MSEPNKYKLKPRFSPSLEEVRNSQTDEYWIEMGPLFKQQYDYLRNKIVKEISDLNELSKILDNPNIFNDFHLLQEKLDWLPELWREHGMGCLDENGS